MDKVTIKAWLPSYANPAVLQQGPLQIVRSVCFTDLDMSTAGFVCVGEADVTLRLHSRETTVMNAVEILRKQQEKVKANAQCEITQLEERIQSLLAITYEAGNG